MSEIKIEGGAINVDGSVVSITFDTAQHGSPSRSGGNMTISTTRGKAAVPVGDKIVYVNFTAYTPKN